MFSCSVQKVPAATPATITKVKHLLGLKLFGGSAASSVKVYGGDANTDPEIAACQCAAAEADDLFPSWPIPAEGPSFAPQNSLRVEVAGTGAYALVYYSPTHG